jgi:integrase
MTASIPRGLYRQKLTWWLRWTPVPGGAQERQSLGTRDLAEAMAAADKLRLREGPRLREEAGSCVAEIDRYLAAKASEGLSASTLSSRRYVLKGFALHTGATSPRHIGPTACMRWFEGRLKRHEHTAVSYLNQVRWWFAWLMERGIVSRDPTTGITIPKLRMRSRKVFLMPADARRLIDECTEPGLKFALFCGLHAGLRKLEIIEARPEWFDLEEGLIHVQATTTFQPKSRDNRTVPLTDEFRAWLLDEYKLQKPFMLAPKVVHGKYRYRFDFRKAFDALVERCQLDITFHDLRRTFASLLVSKGVSLYKVAKWLGDTVEVVEDTYGHLIPQDDEINASWSKVARHPSHGDRSSKAT